MSIPQQAALDAFAKILNFQENGLVELAGDINLPDTIVSSVENYYEALKNNPPFILNPEMEESLDIKKPKIIIICQDHESIKLMSEKINGRGIKTSILESGRSLCINTKVLSSENFEHSCSQSGCQYCGVHSISDVFDIEDIKNYCIEKQLCPYKVLSNQNSLSDALLCTIDYLLDPIKICSKTHNFQSSILIFNDIFNIKNCLTSSLHCRITLEEINNLSKNLPSMIQEFFKKLYYIIIDQCNLMVASGEQSQRLEAEYIFEKMELSYKYCANIKESLILTIENAKNESEITDRQITLISRIVYLFLLSSSSPIFAIDIKFNEGMKIENSIIEFIPVEIGPIFHDIVDGTQSVVLVSHSLSPMKLLEKELMTNFKIKLSSPSGLLQEQQKVICLPKTNDGDLFSDKSKMENCIVAISKILSNVLPLIEGGVVLLSEYAPDIIRYFKRNGIIKKLRKSKKIFTCDDCEDNYKNFKSTIASEGNALLITPNIHHVLSLSGIEIRCLFIYGTLSLKETFSPSDVFRAATRIAVDSADYGVAVILDDRYVGHMPLDEMPVWIRPIISSVTNSGQLSRKLKEFFNAAEALRPKEFKLMPGMPVDMFCKKCNQQIIHINRLRNATTRKQELPGLASILGVESPVEFLPLTHIDSIDIDSKVDSLVWKPEDRLGYNPIYCKCGEAVGAMIAMVTVETTNMSEETLFATDKIDFVEAPQVPKSPIKSKSRSPSKSKSPSRSPSKPKLSKEVLPAGQTVIWPL